MADYLLQWDAVAGRLYETGTKQGVLYVQNADGTYGNGVAWSGLSAVTETPSGAEETALYADDIKYLSMRSAEELGGTIEAYMYPDEFMQCDGSASIISGVTVGQQSRKSFGFCFKTTVGNDTVGNDYGYKLHLIYNATASPSERAYQTINDSPEAITFSWEFTTNKVVVGTIDDVEYKPTSCIIIDSTKLSSAAKAVLTQLEQTLYGTPGDETTTPETPAVPAALPDPATVLGMFAAVSG